MDVTRFATDILTIGALARATDVPTSTIRFYERRGLLKADARSGANYRCYTQRTAERLRFIRSAQASGFSLKDVEEMLALTVADGSPCDDVAAVMERRLAEVRGRTASCGGSSLRSPRRSPRSARRGRTGAARSSA